jgi:hypothetical protein
VQYSLGVPAAASALGRRTYCRRIVPALPPALPLKCLFPYLGSSLLLGFVRLDVVSLLPVRDRRARIALINSFDSAPYQESLNSQEESIECFCHTNPR